MQLQVMDSGGRVLEVPFICYYCGGRSDDLKTLESHIAAEHSNDLHKSNIGRQSSDDEDPADHMLLDGLVEVQIKEEPEFLLPLDLSRKEPYADPLAVPNDTSVWIKQEPPDVDHKGTETDFPQPLPKIRVASEAVLKAPSAPPLLLKVQSVGQQTTPPPPLYPYGQTVDKLLPENVVNIATESSSFQAIRSLLPMVGLPRFPIAQRIPLITPQRRAPMYPPRPRMPNHFPQAPYLLEVPYSCYHCGGRSSDLDTLKTHIETMHNPDILFRQKLAAEAKKRLLESIAESKVVKIKIPKPPKPQKIISKEAVIVKRETEDEVPTKIIIKIPKPFKVEKTQKMKKLEEMANSRYKCPFCPFGGNSFRGLILHATIKHEEERAQRRQEMLETASLSERLAAQSKKFFYCLFCEYKSVSKPQLKKHMHAIHGKEKHYHCPYCTFRTAYSENIKWHIMKHKYKCSNCEFRSTTKANILEHEQSDCSGFFNVVNVSPVKLPRLKGAKRKGKGKRLLSTIKITEPSAHCPESVGPEQDISSHQSLSHTDLYYNDSESPLANDITNPIQTNGEGSTESKTTTTNGEEPPKNTKNDIENNDTSNIVTKEVSSKTTESENHFPVNMVAS